jgi:hypothetical protein
MRKKLCHLVLPYPFGWLSQRPGYVSDTLLTRSPLVYCYPVRLACLSHAASVQAEPGSNSSINFLASVRGGGIVATIPTLSTPRRTQIRGDFFVHSCLRFRDPDHKNLLSETFDKPPAIQSAKKHHRQKCRRRTLRTGILLLSIGFASTTQPALRKECCKPQYATQIVSNRCSSVTAADPGRW